MEWLEVNWPFSQCLVGSVAPSWWIILIHSCGWKYVTVPLSDCHRELICHGEQLPDRTMEFVPFLWWFEIQNARLLGLGGGAVIYRHCGPVSPAPFAPVDSHPSGLWSGWINSQLPVIRTSSALLAFLLTCSLYSFNGYLMGTDIGWRGMFKSCWLWQWELK